MPTDQDSLSKGFDSTSNLGAEGSMARQTAPLPPGSTQIASTAGVPKPSLTPAKPKPATVTIQERPKSAPGIAQATSEARPKLPPGSAQVTIKERPQPQTKIPQKQRQDARSYDWERKEHSSDWAREEREQINRKPKDPIDRANLEAWEIMSKQNERLEREADRRNTANRAAAAKRGKR